MNYNTSVFIITFFVALLLITIVGSNKNFSTKVRKGLIVTFSIVLAGAVCEWLYLSIESGSFEGTSELKFVNLLLFLLQLIKFIVIPVLPLICSKAIFEQTEPTKTDLYLFKILEKYIKIEESLVIICFIYFFKNQKEFYGTIVYKIYIVSFLISVTYLFYSAYKFSKMYQTKNKLELLVIIAFVSLGIILQIKYPDIKTGWLMIAIIATFIYIYYNETVQCIDGLTKLLNHQSFNNYLEKIKKKEFLLITFDINNFKGINDSYGHCYGDEVLVKVGKFLQEVYGEYGRCYRIGGDEFAVMLEHDFKKVDKLNSLFVKKLEKERKIAQKQEKDFPFVSYGMEKNDTKVQNKENINIRERADKKMYTHKKSQKSQTP